MTYTYYIMRLALYLMTATYYILWLTHTISCDLHILYILTWEYYTSTCICFHPLHLMWLGFIAIRLYDTSQHLDMEMQVTWTLLPPLPRTLYSNLHTWLGCCGLCILYIEVAVSRIFVKGWQILQHNLSIWYRLEYLQRNQACALNRDNLEPRLMIWQGCSFLNSTTEIIISSTRCETKSSSKKLMPDSLTKIMHKFLLNISTLWKL